MNPSPPGPAATAACITFDRPNAKSNSSPVSSVTTGTADIASPKPFRNAPASFLRPSSAASVAWTRAPSLPSAIAASTLAKPATTAPALFARASAWRRSWRSAASISSASLGGTLTSALKALAKRRALTAWRTTSARAVTQAPRPGSLRRRSATTVPSGATTKRISPSGEPASRVTMQVRSGSLRPMPVLSRMRLGLGLGRRLALRCLGRRLDPAELDAGRDDHALGVGPGDLEPVEEALVADRVRTFAVGPADEVVGREVGEILDRLDAVLAKRDQHRCRDAVDFPQLVFHSKLLPASVLLGLDAGKVLLRAVLNLAGRVLVEALDGRDLAGIHVGDLLDGAEALGGEELGHDLVDVEGLHEQLGAGDELLLPALRFLGLGQDVDIPAGELRGKPDVLAAAPDGERELVVRHHDLDAVGVLVEHDLDDLGRLQRVDDEGRLVGRPRDDVDLLALELADDRLHARAAHADAGADRIDRRVARDHADLRPRAGVAGDGLHLDDAVVDLGHLLREQLRHELRVGARQEDLRPARLAADIEEIGADPIAGAEGFVRDHLVATDDALAPAEVDDDVAVLDALDDAVDDLADAVLVLVVLAVALGLAHLLDDDLLCRLGGDAAEVEGWQRLGDGIADMRRRVALARLGERDLARVVLDRVVVDDEEEAGEPELPGLRVELGVDVGLGAVAGAGRLGDRVLHRGDDDPAVDHLLAGDRVGDLQKLEPVGANGHGSHSSSELGMRLRRGDHGFFSPSSRGRRCRASSQRLADQLVGEHQPRIADVAQRQAGVLLLAGLHVRRLDQGRSGLRAAEEAAETLAAVERHIHLDLRLISGPALEVALSGERAIDAGRGDLEAI